MPDGTANDDAWAQKRAEAQAREQREAENPHWWAVYMMVLRAWCEEEEPPLEKFKDEAHVVTAGVGFAADFADEAIRVANERGRVK